MIKEPITDEEAELFFRFFYIATSWAKFYQTDGDYHWDEIDHLFRSMRHEFFEGQLPYADGVARYELDYTMIDVTGGRRVTTSAYGEWVRNRQIKKKVTEAYTPNPCITNTGMV